MVNWERKEDRVSLLEEKLYEELGVSEEVKKVAQALTLEISELVENFKTNFTHVKINKQKTSGVVSLAQGIKVTCDLEIIYCADMETLRKDISTRDTDAWYEPWKNTLFIKVDVVNKYFGEEVINVLLQHELTHAYQENMKIKNSVKPVAVEPYKNAVRLRKSEDRYVSTAAWVVYFSNYGEMSANANELYPWFYKTVQDNEPFETYLDENQLYSIVQDVRKLNKEIMQNGSSVLTNAAKQLGVPVGKLKSICAKFPKLAMANICRVYTKAKKDYKEFLRDNAFDYAISEHRRYARNKMLIYEVGTRHPKTKEEELNILKELFRKD